MKNRNLKNLIAEKATSFSRQGEVTILNEDDLRYAMGGNQEVSCPMLTSCSTFSECNQKCTVDGVKVGF